MLTSASRNLCCDFESGWIDNCYTTVFFVAVVCDPNVVLVWLHPDASRNGSRIDVINNFPTSCGDYGDLVDRGQGDEKQFAVACEKPVFAGTLHHHKGEQFASAEA